MTVGGIGWRYLLGAILRSVGLFVPGPDPVCERFCVPTEVFCRWRFCIQPAAGLHSLHSRSDASRICSLAEYGFAFSKNQVGLLETQIDRLGVSAVAFGFAGHCRRIDTILIFRYVRLMSAVTRLATLRSRFVFMLIAWSLQTKESDPVPFLAIVTRWTLDQQRADAVTILRHWP